MKVINPKYLIIIASSRFKERLGFIEHNLAHSRVGYFLPPYNIYFK